MRNTLGKEQDPQGLGRHASDAALRENCDRNYHQLLPIIAEKVHQEKVQQERLKAVKARLNFEETSQHSESWTPTEEETSRKGLDLDMPVACPEALNQGTTIPSHQGKEIQKEKRCSKGLEKVYFARSEIRERCSRSRETEFDSERHHNKRASSRRTEALSKSKGSAGGHWKSRPKRQKSSVEDDMSQPWRQIEEMLKAGELSHLIEELKQSNGKDQEKAAKKWKTSGKEKPLAILMVQPWQRVAKQKITQTFSSESITISIQRDHKKAGSKENPGSSVHSSRNAKISSGRQNEQTIAIASTLTEEGWKKLCGLLRRNLDIFSRKPADMTGVPRHITEHSLNIRERCLPIRQKKRGQAPEQNKAIYEEAKKLVDAGIMKEVHYHSWLSNPVMNLEVYVDDMVIKSCTEKEVIRDIEETFKTLREINMKLNPKKRTFGMREGMFWGYKVNADGLKVCPDKVKAVLSLPYPKCLKDVQRLNGKLSSLNKFLSKSAKKSLPFFKTLKKCTKNSDFQWIAERAFKQMKTLIAELPMLTAPKEKEELVIYLAAAKEAISAVLMTKRDEKQMPIYFVSRALQGPRINKTPMEKLILALVSATKRLKRYFQAHTIVVITDKPIKQMLSNPEVAGRLLKWRFELEEHDIHYRPRTSVKGHILADFIIERLEDDPPDTPIEEKEELSDSWILLTDGSFNATNNEAEYKALIAGLRIAEQMGVKNLQANVDFRLVANQVNETYVAKESGMIKYLEKVKNLASTFKEFLIKQVPRGESKKADALSKMTSTSFAHLSKQVLVKELKEKSINEREVLVVIEEEGRTWMTPIYEYLTSGLPGEIISDNGKQFEDNPFKDWCEKLCIRQCFVSVKHPQANGLVERANRSLGEGIKAWLDERSKNWIEEISHVLWAHSTMIKSSNRETSFSLTYGTKAVIPVEIGTPTLRTAEVDMIKNDEALEINLDILKEKREQAAIQEAKSKAMMEKYYNARVRNTSFKPGDLVYRSNKASHAKDEGKLRPKREGPYEVT
uniref:Reverse transcriptase domain-containing protein n=1 Tax=Tanacetum cinerariifolium TaxID=118510 RepID=A0A6L2J6P1_TANCI|nr:reverse transcriptase domain-containing protein [Tanacetum cinerariifolium]